MSDTKYFTVPIALLQGLISGERNVKDCMQDIVRYSMYFHAINLPYSDDSETGEANKMDTQIKAAANFLNVKIGDLNTSLTEGKRLYEKYHKKGSCCGVNTEIVWDYNNNPKTDYQIALFCAFCATRSIIGDGGYKKTNRDLIAARMFGYTNKEEMLKNTPNITVNNISKSVRSIREKEIAEREKYQNRYHSDKVLTDLELDWGLKRYGNHIRGMYISYSVSLEELAKVCEQSKKKAKIDDLKEKKRQAKIIAETTTS